MKEVMAIIRMDMISKTKDALLQGGFSSLNCRKVLGRGKQKVDFTMIEDILLEHLPQESPKKAEALTEGHRLIPKRLISMVVKDNEVQDVIKILIDTNSKGKQGDGKIFVLPVNDACRVRTGESGDEAI